jgi:hypothetical protein
LWLYWTPDPPIPVEPKEPFTLTPRRSVKKEKGIKKEVIVTSETFIKPERSIFTSVKRARPASAELSMSKRSSAVTSKLAKALTTTADDDDDKGTSEAAENEEIEPSNEILEPQKTAE